MADCPRQKVQGCSHDASESGSEWGQKLEFSLLWSQELFNSSMQGLMVKVLGAELGWLAWREYKEGRLCSASSLYVASTQPP